jgi:hypothetical protein
MLLDRERAQVEWDTKNLDIGKELGPGSAQRENEKLGNNL